MNCLNVKPVWLNALLLQTVCMSLFDFNVQRSNCLSFRFRLIFLIVPTLRPSVLIRDYILSHFLIGETCVESTNTSDAVNSHRKNEHEARESRPYREQIMTQVTLKDMTTVKTETFWAPRIILAYFSSVCRARVGRAFICQGCSTDSMARLHTEAFGPVTYIVPEYCSNIVERNYSPLIELTVGSET